MEDPSTQRRTGGLRLAGGGALAAALASSLTALCCVPVALGAAGATLAALASFLGPYQPYLAGLAVLLVAAAFCLGYRRQARCGLDAECKAGPRLPRTLWLVALAVLLLLTLPYWMPGLS